MKTCPNCQATYPNDFALCPRDGTTLVEVGAWSDGTVVRGKFRILRKVGQGGMGAVYEALHLRFNERRALKVMCPEVANDPEFVKRFEREAILTRSLQHPNAVRVDDIDEAEDGRPFIVMEFVEGQSLKHLIQEQGPLPGPRVCAIIKQVAAALEAAHQLGMVHRDIKPDNIVLLPTPHGEQAKVLDFGIAKLKEARLGDPGLTATGVVIGTPQYMSPEQALGKRGEDLDGRSDLYSLGVVMYQMLTGELPFNADTTLALLHAHAFEPPQPIGQRRPDLHIPAPIAKLVMQCLEKKPENRPASGRVLIDELERAEQEVERKSAPAMTRRIEKPSPLGQALPASQPVAAETWMRRWSRGWRFALLLGAYLLGVGVAGAPFGGLLELVMLVAVLGSLAAGGWYLAGRKRGVRRGVGFVLLTVLATLTAMMIWDTAHRIKYRYTQNLPTPSVPVETPAIRTIRASKGRVECVAFSPDGTLLASGSNDHTVKLWDVQTGELKRTLAGHDFIVGAVAFSPDGQTLVSGAWDDTVKLWDVNSGRLKTTIKTSNGVFAVAVSPDGKLLATGGRSNEHPENNLELWEMPTGKPRGLLKGHTDAVFSLAFSADGSILASGSSDNTVKLWDPQTGTVKRTVTGQPSGGTVPRLAFSPHGTLLAIAGLDPNDDIQLFDMASGASRLIEGSFGYSLAFSPDGKTVAVGANGAGQIELLDVVSGTLKRKLKGPRGVVASLVFSPDGLTLASGSVQYKPGTDETEIEAGTINLWPLQ